MRKKWVVRHNKDTGETKFIEVDPNPPGRPRLYLNVKDPNAVDWDNLASEEFDGLDDGSAERDKAYEQMLLESIEKWETPSKAEELRAWQARQVEKSTLEWNPHEEKVVGLEKEMEMLAAGKELPEMDPAP